MNYIPISSAYKLLVSEYLDDDKVIPYRKNCVRHFLKYVKSKSKRFIKKNDNRQLFVPDTLINDDYIIQYLKKTKLDYDAKDCVHLALNHVGVPPIGELSVESLVRTARDIMKEMKDDVYIKRTKGTSTTFCVNREKASIIASHPKLVSLIDSQILKIDKTHIETIEWRAYEFEKEKIAYLDSLDSQESEDEYHSISLTLDFKTHLMIKAVFDKLFTEFDYNKYEEYLNEMEALYDDWDFGERYQELYDILHAKHYKYEFYQENKSNDFIDILADKIAKRIIKQTGGD